jgi:hypothetical protein
MTQWIRFEHEGTVGFGTLAKDTIDVYEGDMFATPSRTGAGLRREQVTTLTPTAAGKMVALWNNSRAMAAWSLARDADQHRYGSEWRTCHPRTRLSCLWPTSRTRRSPHAQSVSTASFDPALLAPTPGDSPRAASISSGYCTHFLGGHR